MNLDELIIALQELRREIGYLPDVEFLASNGLIATIDIVTPPEDRRDPKSTVILMGQTKDMDF